MYLIHLEIAKLSFMNKWHILIKNIENLKFNMLLTSQAFTATNLKFTGCEFF